MRAMLHRTACLAFLAFVSLPLPRTVAAGNPPVGGCLKLSVSASDLANPGDHSRRRYRMVFENLCETTRVVYWCAEHPSVNLASAPVCVRAANSPGGIAAPLYTVERQREFQWTFPSGTRIRYVDCSESSLPTSDFRCVAPGKRP